MIFDIIAGRIFSCLVLFSVEISTIFQLDDIWMAFVRHDNFLSMIRRRRRRKRRIPAECVSVINNQREERTNSPLCSRENSFSFATPTGNVPVDSNIIGKLSRKKVWRVRWVYRWSCLWTDDVGVGWAAVSIFAFPLSQCRVMTSEGDAPMGAVVSNWQDCRENIGLHSAINIAMNARGEEEKERKREKGEKEISSLRIKRLCFSLY